MKVFVHRVWRRLILLGSPSSLFRVIVWRVRGSRIGPGTSLPARTQATWPHQVEIGRDCILQTDVFFNYSHFWTSGPSIRIRDRVFVGRGVEFNIQGGIEIGEDSLIASGCVFVDHDHGTKGDVPMNQQESVIQPITIERNVWIGTNVVVLKGVTIGEGAVVAAGAIVTKTIPPGEVWGGVPARMLRDHPATSADEHRR